MAGDVGGLARITTWGRQLDHVGASPASTSLVSAMGTGRRSP